MITHYRMALEAALAPQLAERGLLYSPELSDEEGPWFIGPVPTVPGLTMAVYYVIQRLKEGHGLYVAARLISAEVAQVVRDMPRAAWMSEGPENDSSLGRVDLTLFNDHIDAGQYGLFPLHDMASVSDAAMWFTQCVRGPVGEWFSQRNNLDKLTTLSRRPRPKAVNDPSPDPKRLRSTVILCALNGRLAAAADLMGWYLQGDRFSRVDSFERATAFDTALGERFPGYVEARALMA